MAGREIKVQQNTPGWYKARSGVPTMSKLNVLMMDPSSTTYRNYVINTALERVTGKRTETYKSAAMEWGHRVEPLAAARYSIKQGVELRECGFFYDAELNAGASPDRLIVGTRRGVQFKAPEQAAHLHYLQTKQIPSDYRWQMVGEVRVAGLDDEDFCSFNPDFPPELQLVIIPLHATETELEMADMAIKRFNRNVDEVEKQIRSLGVQPTRQKRELVTTK